MEKYLVPINSEAETSKAIRKHGWKRSSIELDGKLGHDCRRRMSSLLMQSYSEVGAFPHLYHMNGLPCRSHMNWVVPDAPIDFRSPFLRHGVSALDFDNKGIYLVSATKAGCLTVHDFEALYCQLDELPTGFVDNESKHLLHLPLNRPLDVVRWNLDNQDEVVCASTKSNEVLIFDVGYISSDPVEVLKTRETVTLHGSKARKGLTDVAFTSNGDSRILASDTNGVINVWDRRMNTIPCLELSINSCDTLNSIQLNVENQIIFGAGRHGLVYMWDIRGGRTSATFQSHKEVCHPPMMSLKLASMLEKIRYLKVQTNIASKEVHSLDQDPSCPYQLAFHLDDGWSGVLDIFNWQVTHIHCPPPAWLNDSNNAPDFSYLRKPSWLPAHSIYMVGSSFEPGIHLLDFYPNSTSPSHVDYNEIKHDAASNHINKHNRFLPLSEVVIACAAHPLNGTIIAGTKRTSLIMISQKRASCQGGDSS